MKEFFLPLVAVIATSAGCASVSSVPDECTFASKLAEQVVIAEQKPDDNGDATEAAVTAAIAAYKKQSGLSDDEADVMYQSMIHVWFDAKVPGATPASVSAELFARCNAYVAHHGTQKSSYDGRAPGAPHRGDIQS